MLMLHGGPGAHHDYLLPQMLQLATSHRLLFYDQRGGGRSRTDGQAPVTWRTHVDDLGSIARELGAEPLVIVGYSWGGLLTLLYALESTPAAAPAMMVLIDPAPITRDYRRRFEDELARRQASPEVRALRTELAASGLRERDPSAYRQRAFELSVAGYFAQPSRARDLTPFRVVARTEQSVWESLGELDLRNRLGHVRAPTLIVHGREDPIPLASSETLAREMPNATLVVLDGSGHVPYVEAPDALFAAIDEWMAAAADTSPTPRQG